MKGEPQVPVALTRTWVGLNAPRALAWAARSSAFMLIAVSAWLTLVSKYKRVLEVPSVTLAMVVPVIIWKIPVVGAGESSPVVVVPALAR